MNTHIYFDYAASTPLDPRVRDAMAPWMQVEMAANPHAKTHIKGMQASHAIEKARREIATAVNTDPSRIVFTSGATESNNMALLGLVKHLKKIGKTHIISSKAEHESVLNVLKHLEDEHGFEVTYLHPLTCGGVETDMITSALRHNTGLVSLQAVNNEVGVINPIVEIGSVLQERGILFHVDAAQALGKMTIDLSRMTVDLMSFSAHKAYGPQGIGALYCKDDILTPIMFGGGQEKGLRLGTLPTALCVGFGHACTLIDRGENNHFYSWRNQIIEHLRAANIHIEIFGATETQWQIPQILNMRIPDIDNETLLSCLHQFSLGAGSACSSKNTQASHVITALASEKAAREAIRISFGRFTTENEINYFTQQFIHLIRDIHDQQRKAS